MGSQFLAVLSENQDHLLNGVVPYAPVLAGAPPPPPLPSNAGVDNIDRSINCVTHIKETLKTFGHRWDDSKALLSSFEAPAEQLLASLRRRKHHIEEISRNSHSPPNVMPQPTFDSMPADEWSNMGSAFANTGALQGGHQGY